ncbi:MAG: AAA family ATPase [Candidatus Bathyarchaeota archaeon]|nr:AAA family ATPase [Candidatus Bathyarchaeota archaeon]
MAEKTVVGITGMPGSGKNTIREVVREFGFPLVVMGDEVRAEARRRNLAPTPENVGKVMLQIRVEEGPGVLARRCIPKIKASSSPAVVVDGIRSMHEVQEYRKDFPGFKIVAIHASPKTRFGRLIQRGRSDDPKDWETFVERDQRELGVGLGKVIATADYMVVNEGTIEQFRERLNNLFKQWVKK